MHVVGEDWSQLWLFETHTAHWIVEVQQGRVIYSAPLIMATAQRNCYRPLDTLIYKFYVHVTVHRNKFLYNKTNRCTDFPNLFWLKNEPQHVSGSSSAHHQEFINCTLGPRTCHKLTSNRMTCTRAKCTVNELLMMGRGTARNM
jgi:hypothetical protein